MVEAQLQLFEADRLRQAVVSVFLAAGSNEREAKLIAGHLVEANLRGHDSHGVGMIPSYVKNIRAGDFVVNQTLQVALDTGAMLICDARQGAGQVMAHDAMDLGIARAAEQGSAIISLRNSHHVGRIGHWAEQCAAAGLVSLHFVNVVAGAFVAPFGGTQARLGTNPFAAAFPRPDGPPLVIDFATSRLAMGKVRVAHNKGTELPPGAIVDNQGQPTTDPAAMFEEKPGSLLPFGEHKGFGLMLACELLGAAVVGAGTQVGPKGPGPVLNSMFSVLLSPERLGTAEPFTREMEAMLAWVLSENEGGVTDIKLPGTPELESRANRLRDGIPLDNNTIEQLREAGRSVGATHLDL